MAETRTPQEMEAERWAGEQGEKWNRYLDQFESMISPVGTALLEAADFQAGERVVDVGCGGGGTSLEIARRVGNAGSVIGLDVAPALVETARRRADEAGLRNVRFVLGDAASTDLDEAGFDCLFSRFGTMFFPEPYAAFRHMHGFLRPGGRLAIAVWAPLEENPWAFAVMQIVRRYVDLPPAEPRAPGPFGLAETDYVRDILAHAGFSKVSIARWQGEQWVGGAGADADKATAFMMDALFVGEALKEAPEAARNEALAEISRLFTAHDSGQGVRMPAKAWFVTAVA